MNIWHSSKDQDLNYPCKVRCAGGNKEKKRHFSKACNNNKKHCVSMDCHVRLVVCLEATRPSVGINSSREIPELQNDCFKFQVNVLFRYPELSGASLQESSVARCSFFGNDHIKTFDGSLYNFAGDCSYLLAGDCHKHSFTLLGESELGSITAKTDK